MASNWNSSSPGSLVSKSNLPLTDIMENGFVAGISSVSNSSPLDDCSIETNTPKAEGWDSNLDLRNILRGTPQLILKFSESSQLTNCSNGGDMPSLAVSNCLASLCRTPVGLASHMFDLSSLATEHNGRFNNSVVDLFGDNKISTPCKEKNHKSMGTQASKSLESSAALIDLSGLLKPSPLIWEISEITSALDNTVSLEASVE